MVRILIQNMGKSIQDYEKFEEERSDFIKDRLLKYVDICVGVDERSAQVCTWTGKNHRFITYTMSFWLLPACTMSFSLFFSFSFSGIPPLSQYSP